MAELNVQPKRKGGWWLRIIVALVVMLVLFFFLRGCNQYQTFINGGPNRTNVKE